MDVYARLAVRWALLLLPSGTALAQEPHLLEAFQLIEITRGGDSIQLNPLQVNLRVDINSSILIVPDLDRLIAIAPKELAPAGRGPAAEPALLERRRHFIAALTWVDESTDTLIALASDLSQLSSLLTTAVDDPAYEQRYNEFRTNVQQFGRLTRQIDEALESYLQATGVTQQTIDAILDSVTPRDGIYTPMRDSLRRWISDLNAENADNVDHIVSAADSITLALGAAVVRNEKASPIHLPGYDTYESGFPQIVPKISLQLSSDEARRLQEEYAFNQRLADVLRNIQEGSADVSTLLEGQLGSVSQLIEAVEGGLASLGTDLRSLKQDVDSILRVVESTVVQPAIESARQGIAAIANVRSSADSLTSVIHRMATGVRTELAAVRPEDALVRILTLIDETKSDAQPVIDTLQQREGNLASAIAGVREAITGAAVEPAMRVRLDSLAQHLASRLDAIQAAVGQTVETVISRLSRFATEASRVAKGAQLASGLSPDLIASGSHLRRRLSTVHATELNLLTVDRSEGDFVQLQVRLSDSAEAIGESSVNFELKKYGLVSGVATGLVFVSTEDSQYSQLSRFVPTAQAAFLIRPRARSGASRVFNLFGLGFHTVPLDFDDRVGIELGIGASLHIFDDVIQLGVGKNLHAAGEPVYWFFGLGILDLLNKARQEL